MPSSDDVDPIAALAREREDLEREHWTGRSGVQLVRSLSDAMDRALAGVWSRAEPPPRGAALVALGGYGRRQLSPRSDVDLMVLHDGSRAAPSLAQRVFYRLWDTGFEVGHATRTIKQSIELARTDLEALTSYIDARPIAGDAELFAEFTAKVATHLRKRRDVFLRNLASARAERHARDGHASWDLEPNLKDGAGGLRDLHTIGWLLAVFASSDGAGELVTQAERAELDLAEELLHRVRNWLHYTTKRRTDVLFLQHQAPCAEFVGLQDGAEPPVDALMRSLFRAARAIEHTTNAAIGQLSPATPRRDRIVRDPHLVVDGGRIAVRDPDSVEAVLRALAVSAQLGVPVDNALVRHTRERATAPIEWTESIQDAFFALLAAGDPAALAEAERAELLTALLPEWAPVVCKPQHNVYHRFTVDVHAYHTVAECVALGSEQTDELAARVYADIRDPQNLLLACLLHDIGKGYPGDHSEAGATVAETIARRMKLGDVRTETLTWLVRTHLVLSDTATRRDTSDENLVFDLATFIRDPERLKMLYVLSIADGRATGPSAWNPWKATLVGELFTKLLHTLERGELARHDAAEVLRLRIADLRRGLTRHSPASVESHIGTMPRAYFLVFPAQELVRHFALMAEPVPAGDVRVHVARTEERDAYELIVVAADRPGLFAVVSGALALNGINILTAQCFTRGDGAALEIFQVAGAFGPTIDDERWLRFEADVRAELRGERSLDAELARKRADYAARPSKGKREPARVVVDNRASDFATVVEVHATDRIGLLSAITRALSELGLDIHTARVATYGEDVVDAFYVRDLEGQRVDDPGRIKQIEHVLSESLHATS